MGSLMEIVKLLNDSRISVFVGVNAFLIAIIIFIAEIVTNKDIGNFERKAILDKLKIQYLLEASILLVLILWLATIINSNTLNDFSYFVYVFVELIIDIMVITLSVIVIKKFYLIIDIRTKEEKRISVLNDYLVVLAQKYYKDKKVMEEKIQENKKVIKDLINQNDKLFINSVIKDDKKNIIRSNNYGVIESYEINKLKKILKEIDINEKIFVLKFPGEYIENNDIIFYTNFDSYNNELSNIININTQMDVNEKEIRKAFENIIMLEKSNKFDKNNYLKSLYLLLKEKKYDEIIKILLQELFKDIEDIININKMLSKEEIVLFIDRITFFQTLNRLALNNDLEDCLAIEDYIQKICYYAVNHTENSKDFAFYYASDVLMSIFYNNKNDVNNKLYINRLSSLLELICLLIKEKKLEEILILAKNMHIGNENKKKIKQNFEFIMGIIKLFILLRKKDANFVDKNIDIIKSIYSEFFNRLFNSDIYIEDILKILNDNNKIMDNIHFMEFYLLRDDYSTGYCGWCLRTIDLFYLTLLCFDNSIIVDDKIVINDNLYDDLTRMYNYNIPDELYQLLDINSDSMEFYRERIIKPLLEKKNEEKTNR